MEKKLLLLVIPIIFTLFISGCSIRTAIESTPPLKDIYEPQLVVTSTIKAKVLETTFPIDKKSFTLEVLEVLNYDSQNSSVERLFEGDKIVVEFSNFPRPKCIKDDPPIKWEEFSGNKSGEWYKVNGEWIKRKETCNESIRPYGHLKAFNIKVEDLIQLDVNAYKPSGHSVGESNWLSSDKSINILPK